MGIETYTIQKGDTLTKIAKEHYGLKGNEAYQKALEIAKENNIANPNLIYAGANLNLLFDEPKEKQCENKKFDTAVEKEDANKEADVVNKYQELIKKQKEYYQYQDAKELYAEVPKDFNPETDSKIVFAKPEMFETDDVQAKVTAYKEAALELANQDIEANDKEDEAGKKDGQLSFEEFEKAQMEFFETSQAAAMKLRAEDQFALEYLTLNGVIPSEDLIAEKGKEIYESMLTQYKASINDMFQAFDIDNNGFLDNTEIATQYVFMDANTTANENAIKVMGSNNEILMAFDGEIDFDDQAIYVKDADEAKEYQEVFGTDYIPVYYTNDRIKEIHQNMFAA